MRCKYDNPLATGVANAALNKMSLNKRIQSNPDAHSIFKIQLGIELHSLSEP